MKEQPFGCCLSDCCYAVSHFPIKAAVFYASSFAKQTPSSVTLDLQSKVGGTSIQVSGVMTLANTSIILNVIADGVDREIVAIGDILQSF